jgi:hypothetical protein
MVDITILELNLSDSSFSATAPFAGADQDDADGSENSGLLNSEDSEGSAVEESGGNGKALAIVGTFVFLVIAAAVVKYLGGDDDHEVEIETPEEPVGVTIDDEGDE